MSRNVVAAVANVVLLVLLLPGAILGYNVDTQQPVVRRGFGEDSFFGFSVAQYRDSTDSWMVVGAPRDNTTTLSNQDVSRPGAVYKCGVSQNSVCEVIDVDTDISDSMNLAETRAERLNNQWLGSSVATAEDGPIVACAHRYKTNEGGNRKLYIVGNCAVLNQNFSVEYQRRSCSLTSKCQTGTSAQVSQDGDVLVLGSPRRNLGQGLAQLFETDSDYATTMGKVNGSANSDYMGYDVDIANFRWTENYYVAVGAPRHGNLFGRVVIFENSVKAQRLKVRAVLDGSQVGAYYGHSVAAVDLNNDGYDDLLVGAPMYSDAKSDIGRVFVYVNNKDGMNMNDEIPLLEKRVLTGSVPGGRFGYAIAKAGDLNGDSFYDVVISAPFADTGGVVYVYHGSADGLMERPSQIIEATDVNYPSLKGFGASISGGMDLDGNTYPDILVGAYLSDAVVLLRSRPIPDVESSVWFSPQSVDYPDVTELDVTLCLQYSGRQLPDQLGFNFALSLDETRLLTGNPLRATFTNTKTAVMRGNVNTQRDQTACRNFTLQLQDQIVDRQPITATLTYELTPQVQPPEANGNPDTTLQFHPVLRSPDISKHAQALFRHSCGNDKQCIPDLQIASAKVNISGRDDNTIVIGRVKTIDVIVAVRNVKENAYNPQLVAVFPREVRFTAVSQLQDTLVSCEEIQDENTTVTCDLGNSLDTGKSIEFGMTMGVGELTDAIQNFTVLLRTDSDNYESETTMADNELETDAIRTLSQVVFGFLEGRANPSRLQFDPTSPSVDVSVAPKTELDVGRLVTHSFTVFNHGPLDVSQSELVIYWPWKLHEGNSSYLLYITKLQTPGAVECETDGLVNPLKLTATRSNAHPTTTSVEGLLQNKDRRTSDGFRSSLSQSPLPQEVCAGGSFVLCMPIRCLISRLVAGGSVKVQVISRLFERSLVLGDIRSLDVTSSATVTPTMLNVETLMGLPDSVNVTTRITEPTQVGNKSLDSWVVVVVVIVTLLILVGVVALLVYFGFFKRSKREQLVKEKEELAATGEVVLHVEPAGDAA